MSHSPAPSQASQPAPNDRQSDGGAPGAEPAMLSYRGKRFFLPSLSKEGFEVVADASKNQAVLPSAEQSPVIKDLNSVWDLSKFLVPREPVRVGMIEGEELARFGSPGAPRVLDMPIKFPGSNFRVPQEFEQFRSVIERIAHCEAALNPECFDEYYCYMTVDQGWVKPETLQREAPCHVDGFQGARWEPKERINHTYVVSDAIPTTYYPQAFDFSKLDIAVHNFFWEMNRQVALAKSAGALRPQEGEISLIDAYTVHRGSEADRETHRTWIRLSFETRKFDRLGNGKNPLFQYEWEMRERDIEGLNLVAFDQGSDPSLRVFPWQSESGETLPVGVKSKPNLT